MTKRENNLFMTMWWITLFSAALLGNFTPKFVNVFHGITILLSVSLMGYISILPKTKK